MLYLQIFQFSPALRVWGIEIFGISVGDGGTAATEAEQFALAALLEAFVLAISVHLRTVEDIVKFLIDRTHITLKAAAGHQAAFGRNGEMAVATVAAVVDGVLVESFGNLEESLLVEEERPEVILQVEGGVHPLAHLVREMERIAHQREGDAARVNQFQEIPETRVQNGVATRDVKIRCALCAKL